MIYEFVCNLIYFLVLLLLVNILGHGTHIQNSHLAGGRLPLVNFYRDILGQKNLIALIAKWWFARAYFTFYLL